MSSPFPAMMQALGSAVAAINHPYYRVPEAQDERVADVMEGLHTALRQLNGVLFFDFPFDGGFPADVTHYYQLLKEYEEPCREKVEYMLDRGDMFPDSFTIAQSQHLTEVLKHIIAASNELMEIGKR